MDAKKELMHEQTNLLTQIAEFAQRGESQNVLTACERLEKVETLIGRCDKLERDISDLDTKSPKSQLFEETQEGSRLVREKDFRELNIASGRGIGRIIRTDFLKRVSEDGAHLRHVRAVFT